VSAEDEEYNPFKRYLKAAVPRENDRFHNRWKEKELLHILEKNEDKPITGVNS
jgi:hypothetical protein